MWRISERTNCRQTWRKSPPSNLEVNEAIMRCGSLRFLLLAIVTSLRLATAQEKESDKYIEFHGPNVHPGYPDAFELYHKLTKKLVSPDGQFGIIYPGPWLIESPPADYVVAVRESRILGLVETDAPYFS